MTTHVPLPSTQIVREKAAPRMRFVYPLAAICAAIVLLSPEGGVAQTGAEKLPAEQEDAIDLSSQDAGPAAWQIVK